MFSSLEDLLFEFFNMYLRSSFLDIVLPWFESSLPVFLVAVVSLAVFAVYCKKTYGEMFYRFLLFFCMLGLSAVFAHEGSKFFSFERPRPYQEIAGTMYYNAKEDIWLQAQYAESEGYHPVSETAEAGNAEAANVENTAAEAGADRAAADKAGADSPDNVSAADTVSETPEQISSAEAALSDVQDSTESAEVQTDNAGSESFAEAQKPVQHPLNINTDNIKLIDGSAKLYPSSVLSISMAIAFVIALLMARTSPYIYLFPLLIGWTQVYTGNAYLSDVLVGWIVGILAVVAAWLCFAFFFRFTGKNA